DAARVAAAGRHRDALVGRLQAHPGVADALERPRQTAGRVEEELDLAAHPLRQLGHERVLLEQQLLDEETDLAGSGVEARLAVPLGVLLHGLVLLLVGLLLLAEEERERR